MINQSEIQPGQLYFALYKGNPTLTKVLNIQSDSNESSENILYVLSHFECGEKHTYYIEVTDRIQFLEKIIYPDHILSNISVESKLIKNTEKILKDKFPEYFI